MDSVGFILDDGHGLLASPKFAKDFGKISANIVHGPPIAMSGPPRVLEPGGPFCSEALLNALIFFPSQVVINALAFEMESHFALWLNLPLSILKRWRTIGALIAKS